MRLLAIDPGNVLSAYVVVDEELRPLSFGKVPNEDLLDIVRDEEYDDIVVEMIASYGMPVGREVFDTCRMIGRIEERAVRPVHFVFRKDEKIAICGSMRATDATIRRALIDRFAKHDLKTGKGSKSNPDWFFGFAKDVWSAFAVAMTYMEGKT